MRNDDNQVAADLQDPEPLTNRRPWIIYMLEAVTGKHRVLRVVGDGQGTPIVPGITKIDANCLGYDGNHILLIAFIADVEDCGSGQIRLDKPVTQLGSVGLASLCPDTARRVGR